MKFQEKKVSIIKLIIWDLDETFWKGTLSDNVECVSVTPIEEHIQLIKKLVHRGILNAVCSKNSISLLTISFIDLLFIPILSDILINSFERSN